MSKIEALKLKYLQDAWPMIKSSSEALQFALQAEETRVACGPHDPAFRRFAEDQRQLENLAELLEKQENNT